jgi:hypothetical protein
MDRAKTLWPFFDDAERFHDSGDHSITQACALTFVPSASSPQVLGD